MKGNMLKVRLLGSVIIILFGTMSLSAKEMKCAYDYGGGIKITLRFVTLDENSGDLEYYYTNTSDSSSEVETKGVEPYKVIGNNLYYHKSRHGLGITLHYINFKTAKHHEIQFPASYMKNANELPARNFNDSEVLPGIPVYIWECERLD